jgi:hypothetical protein
MSSLRITMRDTYLLGGTGVLILSSFVIFHKGLFIARVGVYSIGVSIVTGNSFG